MSEYLLKTVDLLIQVASKITNHNADGDQELAKDLMTEAFRLRERGITRRGL